MLQHESKQEKDIPLYEREISILPHLRQDGMPGVMARRHRAHETAIR